MGGSEGTYIIIHTGCQVCISNDGAHALLITTSHKFYLWEETSRKEETLTSDSQW